jgi:23S rRNA (adenine2503-C2)-methyltransferase
MVDSPLIKLTASIPGRLALQGATPADIVRRLPEVRIEEARRIVSHVYRGGVLGQLVPTVRRLSTEAVAAAYDVPTLTVKSMRKSALDPFVKFLLSTPDDKLLETVRIPLERPGRFTACVSSQVGCALGCTFCATGRMGLRRNLEAWEIVEQVRIVRASIAPGEGRVHGIVFQGMGEALANLDRVLAAIAVLTNSSALAIDQRTFTVCTSGLPSGIRRLAQAAPRTRLAVSIGSARSEVRSQIMPINIAHPLSEVMDAAVEHALQTGLAPMWALTLLGGVNDTDADAHALGVLAQDFTRRSGYRPRVTIIPYNATAEGDADPFVPATLDREDAMRTILAGYAVYPHRRYSGGSDVGAACGQLSARE